MYLPYQLVVSVDLVCMLVVLCFRMYPAAGSTRSVCVDVHHQHDHVVGDLETDRVCVHITQAPMNASISEPPVGCNIEMSYIQIPYYYQSIGRHPSLLNGFSTCYCIMHASANRYITISLFVMSMRKNKESWAAWSREGS